MLPAPSTAIFVRAGRATVCDHAGFSSERRRVLTAPESPLDAEIARTGRGFTDAFMAGVHGASKSGSMTTRCDATAGNAPERPSPLRGRRGDGAARSPDAREDLGQHDRRGDEHRRDQQSGGELLALATKIGEPADR